MRMKDESNRFAPASDDLSERGAVGAPGKRTRRSASVGAVQRQPASTRRAAETPPRSASEIVPISSDVSFVESIISSDRPAVQFSGQANDARDVHALADHGTSGAAETLPFMDQIQRSFGNHDVSGIKAHNDGAAEQASRGMGAHAFAVGDHVAFGGAPDLHTAAHEAAHVVQQRGGVQLSGGVGQAGDAYEQHADAVADAVVAGESAEALLDDVAGGTSAGAVQQRSVQRFGAREHQNLGNEGTGGAAYTTAGLRLNHGDLVMLRGDHFSEEDIVSLWNQPSGRPGRMKGTQDEIIYAIHLATSGKDPRFDEGGPWNGMKFSDDVKHSVDEKYLARAAVNDEHFVTPRAVKRDAPATDDFQLGSAPDTYHGAHERAIYTAYRSALASESVDNGMIIEAMGQHYLTDAFAAGHLVTPRTTIREHWNGLYPNFFAQFKAKVTRDMATWLGRTAFNGTMFIPEEWLREAVQETLEKELAGKPPITIGDMVALTAHDYDNANGMWVTNDVGYRWFAKGDGHLADKKPDGAERSHASVALEAVRAGADDVRHAHSLGVRQRSQGTKPLPRDQIFQSVREASKAPAKPGVRFAPEQFMPRPEAAGREQFWNSTSLEGLWAMQVRKGSPTYGELIVHDFQNGESGKQLDAIANNIPEKQWAMPWRVAMALGHSVPARAVKFRYGAGYVKPRVSFQRAVIERLKKRDDCLSFLLELVSDS
ncbi:MAG: DUF4157 domain-containing protein [Kofleriaceae bacterium]|nr:DUF4157 domain-containing protein [Kofleriaceae bacterium]